MELSQDELMNVWTYINKYQLKWNQYININIVDFN